MSALEEGAKDTSPSNKPDAVDLVAMKIMAMGPIESEEGDGDKPRQPALSEQELQSEIAFLFEKRNRKHSSKTSSHIFASTKKHAAPHKSRGKLPHGRHRI